MDRLLNCTLSFCMIHLKCLSISYQQEVCQKKGGRELSAIADSQKKTHLSTFVEGTLDFRNQFWVLCRIHLHHHIANTYRLNTDYFALSICMILSIHWAFIPSWTRSSSSESDQPALDGFNVAPSCFKRLFACLLFAAIFYQKEEEKKSVGK